MTAFARLAQAALLIMLVACAAPVRVRERPADIGPGPQGLPLGDGWISDRPMVGHVWSCERRFAGGGGAHRAGEWIGAVYWDPTRKPQVDGAVMWPAAESSVARDGARRLVVANGLPNHATGVYPISNSDDAYRYDRNPNAITAQQVMLVVRSMPTLAASPRCVPMGAIGYALNGVAIFNALDLAGRDAPAYEIQDVCSGHPEVTGQYHYHDHSSCLRDATSESEHSALLGYAIDGFGIYGLRGEAGRALTTNDLDECHGHSHTVDWDNAQAEMYHYHMTPDYPYTIGCLRGE
jgi:hypothetical protein